MCTNILLLEPIKKNPTQRLLFLRVFHHIILFVHVQSQTHRRRCTYFLSTSKIPSPTQKDNKKEGAEVYERPYWREKYKWRKPREKYFDRKKV